MTMLSPTTDRPSRLPVSPATEQLRHATETCLERYACRGPEAIEARLQELDREWDLERALETQSASLALAGLALGAFLDRRFLVVPALVSGFLLQQSVQGWSLPVPLLRRLGFRSTREIERERLALKAMRGDFAALHDRGGSLKINVGRIASAVN